MTKQTNSCIEQQKEIIVRITINQYYIKIRVMNNNNLQSRNHMNKWNQFIYKADKFMRYTSHYALQEDISPGGHYSAIWLRDAAYIL